MTNSACATWVEEIRDFLVGRLASSPQAVGLTAPSLHLLSVPPIRRWWIFEGKRYGLLGGGLAAHFAYVLEAVRRLDAAFSPRLRLSEWPDGDVDWGQTIARGGYGIGAEFVIRSSGVGLTDSERTALRGWVRWLHHEWIQYRQTVKSELTVDCGSFASEIAPPFPADRLRKWAHIARRSRWPLLREVMAESLRPLLEPDELDALPLPSEAATLFELLCIVRISRHFVPHPRDVRWLDLESAGNKLQFDGLTCQYQQSLGREAVLASDGYRGSLAAALTAFKVRVPERVDIAFDFSEPIGGFNGIIVEAKSGSQTADSTVAQLRTYRAVRRRRPGSRYLIWGIVEKAVEVDATPDRILQATSDVPLTEDVWLFSSAQAISVVLNELFALPHGAMTQ